jgi:hypothetical protein
MMQESPHHTAVAASESPVFFARQPVLDANAALGL